MPVEYFMVDPPQRVDAKALGLTDIGVKLIEVNGVYHIFDIIGEKYYPNVADMVEEIRRLGMSRRCELASAEEYAKITPESTYVLLHRRAWIGNCEPYYRDFLPVTPGDTEYNPCPANLLQHDPHYADPEEVHFPEEEPCLGLCWNDVDGLELDQKPGEDGTIITDTRLGTRTMPSFTYKAANSPILGPKNYELAIFMRLPITRFVIVRGGKAQEKLERVKPTGIAVEEVDE
jgi:hypothetical protein